MESSLCIAFQHQNTYLCGIRPNTKGIDITYVNALTEPLDLSNDRVLETEGVSLLHEAVFSLPFTPESLHFTLPKEWMSLHHLPSLKSATPDEIHDILSLELMTLHPNSEIADVEIELYTLTPKLDGSEVTLATMVEKSIVQRAKSIFAGLSISESTTTSQHIAAQSAFLYNYPESSSKNVVLFGIHSHLLEVSVLINEKMAYYSAIPHANTSGVSDSCDTEIDKILTHHAPYLDACYFYGEGLTQVILTSVRTRLTGLMTTIERLNSFRMTTTLLDEETRQLCSQLSHIFAPALGGALQQHLHSVHTLSLS